MAKLSAEYCLAYQHCLHVSRLRKTKMLSSVMLESSVIGISAHSCL